MICTFLRSSSMQTHSICEQQYYLEYTLGIQPPSGKSAAKGNVVHKALEIMAHVGICRRGKQESYRDDIFGEIEACCTPEMATLKSFAYYSELCNNLEWSNADLRDCLKWTNAALEFNGGQYDPRELDVIRPEQRFDLVINEPWAKYDYTLYDGTRVEGQLGLKGTIDLVVRDPGEAGVLEIIDWKTGARKDWSKEGWAKKTYGEIRHDPQLCLYHYAVSKLYPEMEEVFVTIFYINDGGPYSLCFEPGDVEETEKMLEAKFNAIRGAQVPRLSIGRKCTTFCYFGTHQSEKDPSKTICEFIRGEVEKKGIEETTHEHGRKDCWKEYGTGGGRTNVE